MIVPAIALSLPKIAIDAFWLVSAIVAALVAAPIAIVLGCALFGVTILVIVAVLVFCLELLDTILSWLARQMGKPYRKAGNGKPDKSKYSMH